MSCTARKIDHLRLQIPSFACVPGCHDCCGPVTASSEEMARLAGEKRCRARRRPC